MSGEKKKRRDFAMEFTVKIRLGNAAMQTIEDIAMALAGISGRLEWLSRYRDPLTAADAAEGVIHDDNGNPVRGMEHRG